MPNTSSLVYRIWPYNDASRNLTCEPRSLPPSNPLPQGEEADRAATSDAGVL